VIDAMKILSALYPRYGYRRISIFLRRQGHAVGVHRTHRLGARPDCSCRGPGHACASLWPLPPANANFVWAYDLVFDTTAAGQQIKCLTVVDEFTRECLAIDVAGSIRSRRVIDVLARLVSMHGEPLFLRSDYGPEFVSHAILDWIARSGIGIALIDPVNGSNESFNGKLRDECLSLEWFRSRAEATVVIETWRRHYNVVRPPSSLNCLTPIEFKQQHQPIPNRAVLRE
jgi:putative transposase